MIPEYLPPLANHLWQSTTVTAVAALLAWTLRKNMARVRYWLWFLAAAKFLIPFSILVSLGHQFEWRTPVATSWPISTVAEIGMPFDPIPAADVASSPHPAAPITNSGSVMLLSVWLFGFAVSVWFWLRSWLRVRAVLNAATPINLDLPLSNSRVRTISSPTLIEPAVFGIFKPVLLLPEGITDRMSSDQLKAVLVHELCHVRRRDNLATAIYMVAETLFWFYPLVRWIGSRLVDERELACDEDVLRLGNEPIIYAEGIVGVCKGYLESPFRCTSGVAGSDLKRRIRAILDGEAAAKLSIAKKAALVTTGVVLLAMPIVVGSMKAAPQQITEKFEVASVKRVEIPFRDGRVPVFPTTGGIGTSDPSRITYRGTWLLQLIADAFEVRSDQITGPAWLTKERYDIVANIPTGATKDQFQHMLGNLLIDRFRLRFHTDSKIRPIYALRVGKNGPKVKQTERRADDATVPSGGIGAPDAQGCPILPPNYQGMVGRPGPGEICWTAQDVPLVDLARLIEQPAGRPVIDETNLTGRYDFKIHFQSVRRATDAAAASDPAPSVFAAVEQQLGLKLESATHSFPGLIIDSIERDPTEN